MSKPEHDGRTLCIILLVMLVLSILPLLWLGKYAVPAADDFSYGSFVIDAVRQGKPLKTIWNIIRGTGSKYLNWQGSFSAIALFIMQPGNWEAYAITPWIMIIHLSLGMMFFCIQTMHDTLRCMTRWQAMSVAAIWILLSIQLMPVPVEGLYWYNGAIYYTFFYGWFLILLALVIRIGTRIRNEGRIAAVKNGRLMVCFAGALAFVLGGGNLITGLIAAVLSIGILFVVLRQRYRCYKILSVPAFLLLAGFLINVAAPGNRIRQTYAPRMNIFKALHLSFEFAVIDFFASMCLPMLAGLLLVLPILWKAAGRSTLSFRWPGIVTLAGLCLSASMYFPTMYAVSAFPGGRIQNIIQYTYFFVVLADLWYWSGWLQRRKMLQFIPKLSWRTIAPLVSIAVILVLILSAYWPGQYMSLSDTTTWQAIEELVSGEAETFWQEEQERTALLRAAQGGEVFLRPHAARPYLLFMSDIGPGQPEWVVPNYEEYFDVERITVVPSE